MPLFLWVCLGCALLVTFAVGMIAGYEAGKRDSRIEFTKRWVYEDMRRQMAKSYEEEGGTWPLK